MKKILLLLVFSFSLSFSQQNYEYIGAIKLNGDKKTIITYRIFFSVNNGKINGFSITDFLGDHETKNKISGTYNSKTKEIQFKEENILYTKSPLSKDSFCFVNFAGRVKLVDDNNKLSGNFKGLFQNKSKCIDGSLELFGIKKIEKIATKFKEKIQKSKKVEQSIKDNFNPISILDSLKVNSLTKNQNLNIFVSSNEIEIEVWDAKIEDGDRIDLFHNTRRILDNIEVTNKKKTIKVNLIENENKFKIVALNEGERTLNTAMIRLIDGDRNFELTTNLKKGETTSITIIKN
ncbi:hypothetical protein WFZ85_01570 [Flavobacterium sp. j3]|uniref:Uncharacterized protein n=1 Tax=Flavobacterium aureirubrum TaxID=3133147 RepID=A0ABU9N5R6_9FLAO